MSCFDCDTGMAKRRVEAFLRTGGKRLYLPCPGGLHVVTILGFSQPDGELRLRDEKNRVFEASACRIPPIAFAGVA